MRTSRWLARLFVASGTVAVFTSGLTGLAPASHADVKLPHEVFEVSDGVAWH